MWPVTACLVSQAARLTKVNVTMHTQPRRKKVPGAPRSTSCRPRSRGTHCPLRAVLLPGRAPPPTASEAPPCGLFTDTLLVPKAWLQGRLLRDALPGLIHAPVNLAAGQVQARPLSSASTSAGRGPGPPALHAPRGSAHCPGSEPLGRSRQRCRCLWGSQRCQLPFPGLAMAGPLPPLPAAAGPARAPAAAPRWASGPAAASSKLSCPAVRPSPAPSFAFRFAEAPSGLAFPCAPRARQGLSHRQ